jgi:hypothetical protein
MAGSSSRRGSRRGCGFFFWVFEEVEVVVVVVVESFQSSLSRFPKKPSALSEKQSINPAAWIDREKKKSSSPLRWCLTEQKKDERTSSALPSPDLLLDGAATAETDRRFDKDDGVVLVVAVVEAAARGRLLPLISSPGDEDSGAVPPPLARTALLREERRRGSAICSVRFSPFFSVSRILRRVIGSFSLSDPFLPFFPFRKKQF